LLILLRFLLILVVLFGELPSPENIVQCQVAVVQADKEWGGGCDSLGTQLQVSNDQNPGDLLYMGDEILPSSIWGL